MTTKELIEKYTKPKPPEGTWILSEAYCDAHLLAKLLEVAMKSIKNLDWSDTVIPELDRIAGEGTQ